MTPAPDTSGQRLNVAELIRRKRAGGALADGEVRALIAGYAAGTVPDYQMSAFLMAVCFRGMTDEETTALVQAMLHSGRTVDLADIPGRKVDKHSTGGVGDKVSLILAPMVAACGVPVPMISGRGLGHTGGTLDKLEAIPGFRTDLSVEEYRRVLAEQGLVLIGQTAEIVPADRKMYALRDVTGTVESIPLIAGSIMSKKIAEGIDALVLDVKTGDGAFMQSMDDATALARALVAVGTAAGKETVAFITEMDQPLGRAVGNWCEVAEALRCLQGEAVPDLMALTLVLGGAMVVLGGAARGMTDGIARCREAIRSGRALERFLALCARQGGDVTVLHHPERYPRSAVTLEVTAARAGYVGGFEVRRIGVLAAELGAGRMTAADRIDPKAGMLFLKKRGDPVASGEPLALLFTDRTEAAPQAREQLRACIRITDAPPPERPLVRALVDASGVRTWDPSREEELFARTARAGSPASRRG